MQQENSGFHYVRTEDNNGTHVSSVLLDNALPIAGNAVRPWKYDQCVYGEVPLNGRAERNFYTHTDIQDLTGWSPQESVRRARKSKWRYRVDPTSKIRAYYLYDILATDWQHMLRWSNTTLDQALVAEARG
jgi:hypothetical protein